MVHSLSRLTLNQRLALLAFALGAVAMAAKPARQPTVSITPQDLALIVQREVDHVTATAVADQLVKGQAEFGIIDVRDESDFAAYHLPTAENVPISLLPQAGLPRTGKILLYADDGVHAAQAWFLLKAQGYRGVYMLRGGLAEWRDTVVSPLLENAATPEERQENDRRAALAAYFGGTPRTGNASAAAAAVVTPSPPLVAAAPAVPSGPARQKPVVKKKEGC